MPKSRIIVPASDFLPLLFECLLGVMSTTAEEVEQCEYDLDAYPPTLARFDRIRALLDSTGWGEHGDIDLSEHAEALQDALSDRLATERAMRASAEKDADAEGRQRASDYASRIEAFMVEAELTIPDA